MDNPEKLATHVTQDEEKTKQTKKHNMCWTQQTNTKNVNKTSALLQTTGGCKYYKDYFINLVM